MRGRHHNPTGDPAYFTTAYFHRPEELAAECAAAGLVHEATLAVEGPGWLLPDLDARLTDDRRRPVLLAALAALEAEPALLGASAHLLAVARTRPEDAPEGNEGAPSFLWPEARRGNPPPEAFRAEEAAAARVLSPPRLAPSSSKQWKPQAVAG